MHFLVANLCWLLCFFGIQDSDDATTYTLEDGVTWVAQLGQDVIVRAMDRDSGKEKVYTGKIDKLYEMYVKISGETIFIDDIVRVTLATEGEQIEIEPEEIIQESRETTKKTRQVVTGYVVVELQGKVGIIPEDIAGNFSTEYISANSIAEMLKKLNYYKKVQHIVFVVDSTGGDSIAIAKIEKVLDKYKKRYTYHAIVAKKDTDPLQIANSCDGIFASEPFVQGGYDGVAEDFERSKALFERSKALYTSEFQKMFWKGLLQDSYTIQYLKAYEFAKQKTNHLLPKESITPKAIGVKLEYVEWIEFPKKSKTSNYVIEKNKGRQIKDMVRERRELFAIIQQIAKAKMDLLSLPELKRLAVAMNPSSYEYETEIIRWRDGLGMLHEREEFTQDSKDLWNKRLNDARYNWWIIVNTLNATYGDPLVEFAKIVRDKATSGTQREIREDAKLAIEEEKIKLSNAYEQAYPLLITAEQNILSLRGMDK